MAPTTRDAAAGEDRTMPIAIVGIGCRLPDDATSPEKLWDMLMQKKSARRETPPDRFNIDAFNHPDADRNGSINNRGGHFLAEDLAAFDAPFFSISPAEAISMDPMQRILLEVVYEAMENAGIPLSRLAGSDASCFVGCFTSDYDQLAKRDAELLPKYHSIGTGQSILSNRISFCFDLRGPSVTLDTACSSSLVAVHLACQSLRTGESKTAIVGASNAILSPDIQIGMTNLHFLSPDSTCYTFDERANGYARGEGMAALILKPLNDAIRDGDTIRAVIRGTAVNSDGKTPGITLPSKEAQISLIRSAYEQSGCDPTVTGYFEAHGTGTPAGDPLEAGAVGAALGPYRSGGEEGKLYVGSIKTNIGHLEGASGLAGLIKAVLSVEKGIIAPNLWFKNGNPAIDFDGWRIRVPTEPTPWPVSGLRRASVNSFGYGGTNGHVIVDDAYHYMQLRGLRGNHSTHTNIYEESHSSAHVSSAILSSLTNGSKIPSLEQKRRPRIFQFAAHEENVAKNVAKTFAQNLQTRLENDEEKFLDDLAFTLSERRSLLPWSSFVVATTKAELLQKLGEVSIATRRLPKVPRLGFVFTGQGAQWWAMGRKLLEHPVFASTIAATNKVIQKLGASWSLLDELVKSQSESRIDEAAISQPLCTAVQIALVDLYASWDIHPSKVVGHSSGEIAAAYTTGSLTLESAMSVAYFRGLLSSNIKNSGQKGGMMAVGLSEVDVRKEIEKLGVSFGKAVVGCVNSPHSVTLSGDLSALTQLQKIFSSRRVFARKLLVNTAYHSHHMLVISEEYRQILEDCKLSTSASKPIEMFSSVTGRLIQREHLTTGYWVDNMVSCVRFSDALESLCTPQASTKRGKKAPASVDLLIELGPHAALAGPVKQVLVAMANQKPSPVGYLSALIRGKDAAVSALEVAASLSAQGYPVNVHAAHFPTGSKKQLSVLSDLPSYCWNHSRTYWAESRLSRDYRFRRFPRSDILGAPFHDWNPIEPRWRNFIRLSEQPWVKGHNIQGAILYPAAGFCCMAIEAAAQMSTLSATTEQKSISEYKIRDLSIARALVVPQTEEGVEIIFSMRPNPTNSITSSDTWSEFRIFSYTTAGGWAEHCRGLVVVVYHTTSDGGVSSNGVDEIQRECKAKFDSVKSGCCTKVDSSALYQTLDAAGFSYGPDFQGVIDISIGNGQAVGEVHVTNTRSAMPKEFEFERILHPATMDTFLQMSIAALSQGDITNIKHPYVPTFIKEVTVSSGISGVIGQRFQVAAEAKFHGFREAYANVVAVEENGLVPVVQLNGVKCMAITNAGSLSIDTSQTGVPKHCASAIWDLDIDLVERVKLNPILRASLTESPSRLKDFELLAYRFTSQALEEVNETEISSMLPHHQQFFRYLQHQREMVLSNTHEQQTEEWVKLKEPNVVAKIERLIQEFANASDYEGRMFVRMGQALPAVLRQEIEPLALMMENNLLYDYYTVGLGTKLTYPQIAKYVTVLSHKYPDLDYLEIGAGTGGATFPVLQALSGCDKHQYPRLKSFTYTDISTGFFEQAAEKFSKWAGLMEFKKLDIEQDPDVQGFKDGRFDVILAANVLHATYDIDRTMAHVRKLLRPGGKLILLDMTHSLLSVSLIFGNLPGWWNCVEPWRQHGPLLDESQWRDTLQKHGFTDLQASTPDFLNSLEEGTRVMIATAVEEKAQTEDINGVNGHVPNAHAVIITPKNCSQSSNDFINIAESTLSHANVSTKICTLAELQNSDMADIVFISFVELEDSIMSEISPSDFAILQRLTQQSAGLIWVTRGGTSTKGIRPELSLFQGLARSLRAEKEGFPCITIDFDAEHKLPANQAMDLLFSVYTQTFGPNKPSGVLDREFSEEGGVLRIKRAVEDAKLNQYIAARTTSVPLETELQDIWQQERALKLKIKNFGSLDSFFFDDDFAMYEPLPEDQVEIEVCAVGLNFRDILISMGEISDNYLGNECSGVVTDVGANVHHLSVGDRVAAWCLGSFSTRMRNPAHCVQPIPDTMSFSTAAGLPLAYVTAYYGLIYVAHLSKGESVLIHAAAGGVGQAAIQIAKMVEAEIFVTVGTELKKTHLIETYGIAEDHIFGSRDLKFARGIEQATSGRGIDVVLNSLAGDALQATWKCIAPFGRFVEIGKKDIDINTKLEMSPFAKNVTFTSVDVTVIFRQNTKLAKTIFSKAMELVKMGLVKEVSPTVVQPFSKMEECFRQMQAGKHIGKIVLEPRAGDRVPVMPKPLECVKFPGNASYLLAGGLGGLGRSMSRWMIRNGARNFIYVSRYGASSKEATNFIKELEVAGVRSAVLMCDITHEAKLAKLLAEALEFMPRIRGVIQGAMVLKDQVFANMSHDIFMNTIRPKVQGSWALHNATLQQPLDFFVLLSSAAGFIGNAGQSNYVAGCTYQVALAAHRNSLGLPATAIDIGKVTGVGFVAENAGSKSEQNLVKLGMLNIQEEELLAMLELAMLPRHEGVSNGHMITGVHSTIDTSREDRELPFWSRDPVFSHMEYVRPHLIMSRRGNNTKDVVQQPLPKLLASATSVGEVNAYMLDALLRKLSRSLMMPLEDIDASKSTAAYGIDSLIAVEIRNWFFREAKADIPVFEILQVSTLTALAEQAVSKSSLVG
ncbi:hypothetical protein V499_00041 [Pseudogymnoascus sp. VKM F-103]|nr:hypothetical protein V499_00041 [Pseudogymnoascus sp. VKM F-103]